MGIAILLHVLSATVWVGGMFFALVCLRPASAEVEPSVRMKLWAHALRLFFPWVWMSIVLLLATGLYMTVKITSIGEQASFIEHLKAAGTHVHIMIALGLVMMLLAAHVNFAPLKRLKRAVAENHWTDAGKSLNQIRVLIAVNLSLGLIVVAVAASGRYFFR